jgi:hypothetical protein
MNFNFWVIVLSEIHPVEDRVFTSPITSLKKVFQVKQSYLLQRGSKLCETSGIINKIVLSILGENFKISYLILDLEHSVQVHSPK